MKRISSLLLVLLLFLTLPVTSYATEAETAPTSTLVQMSDGGYFDPVFFAATYPDLVALIGTDPNTMYQHYLKYGQCLGMKPFADDTIQSLTYQSGSIVVPASVKAHPEARDTLLYTDAYIDIYYSYCARQSWLDGRDPTFAIVLNIFNKTNGDMTVFTNTASINGQMQYCLLHTTLFAGTSAEDSADFTKYPDSNFDNINSSTMELKYKASAISEEYHTIRFNIIFYH